MSSSKLGSILLSSLRIVGLWKFFYSLFLGAAPFFLVVSPDFTSSPGAAARGVGLEPIHYPQGSPRDGGTVSQQMVRNQNAFSGFTLIGRLFFFVAGAVAGLFPGWLWCLGSSTLSRTICQSVRITESLLINTICCCRVLLPRPQQAHTDPHCFYSINRA